LAVALLALVGDGVAYAMRGGGTTPDATATVPLVLITATSAPVATATSPPATATVPPADTATVPAVDASPTVPAIETPTVPVVVPAAPTVVTPAGRILFGANLGTPPGTLEVLT